jgi:hypothetical protein
MQKKCYFLIIEKKTRFIAREVFNLRNIFLSSSIAITFLVSKKFFVSN